MGPTLTSLRCHGALLFCRASIKVEPNGVYSSSATGGIYSGKLLTHQLGGSYGRYRRALYIAIQDLCILT